MVSSETVYELRCNECGKSFGNRPLSACDECLAPLEVQYDLESVRGRFTRESIAAGPASIWRYKALLPIPEGYQPDLPVGFTVGKWPAAQHKGDTDQRRILGNDIPSHMHVMGMQLAEQVR